MKVYMYHLRGDFALPGFVAIVDRMKDRDFATYDILSYQTRPFNDALSYVDLAFAPDNGALGKHHCWA